MSWLGQAAGRYFGAWWGASQSSQAAGGAGATRRKRYFIEQAGRLLVFASAAAAQTALLAAAAERQPANAPAQAGEPVVPQSAEQQIDLAALQAQAALAGQLAAYQAAYQSRHFAALLALFERLQVIDQDEDDVELLLLSL